MMDWQTETEYRCTACNTDYADIRIAMKCHQAPTVAVVDCSNCGDTHVAETGHTARKMAEECCRAR